MKKLIVFAVLSLMCYTAFAQEIELYGRYTLNGTVEPDINLYGTKKISSKFDFTYFFLVERAWGETYVGVTYSPVKWLSLGLAGGIERNPAAYRLAGSTWIGNDATSFLLLWEKGEGKSNFWFKTMFTQKLSKNFTIGAVAWRFHGEGLYLGYNFKKIKSTIWLIPAYDFEDQVKRLMLGFKVKI